MVVYHYTDAEHIDTILRMQLLLPRPEAGAGPLAPHLLWASPETPWAPGAAEYTTGPPRLKTFTEMLQDHGPLYRILLSTQHFLTVRQFLAREPRAAHGIATVAGEVALNRLITMCPWHCSYAPIPASQWLGIETWDPAQAQGVTYRPEQR